MLYKTIFKGVVCILLLTITSCSVEQSTSPKAAAEQTIAVQNTTEQTMTSEAQAETEAEVETEAQAEILRSFGCDQMQGYLFSKPISVKAFENLNIHEGSMFHAYDTREPDAVNYAP